MANSDARKWSSVLCAVRQRFTIAVVALTVVDEWKWEFDEIVLVWVRMSQHHHGIRSHTHMRQISNATKEKKKHNSHCIPHHTYWISDEIIHLESVPIYDKTHVLISYCLSSSWSYVLVRPKRTWNQTLQVDVPKSEKTHVISMMIIFGDIYVECRMWRYSSTFWGKAHSYSHIRRHTIVIRYVNAVLRFSVLKRTAVCQKSETKYLCEKNGN